MVVDKMTSLAEQFGTSEIMCVFRYGGMSHELAEQSMRLFAREVLPRVRQLQPGPISLAPAS